MSSSTLRLTDCLPSTYEVLVRGEAESLHIGAQVYVSLAGEVIVDDAIGEARSGVQMTPDTLMLWFCSGKPIGAVAIAQLLSRGLLTLDTPVASIIEGFGQKGKADITVRHLLTQTAGFGSDPAARDVGRPWATSITRVCEFERRLPWPAGAQAEYSVSTAWLLLAEIVRLLDGRAYETYVRDEVLLPAGMHDSWVALPMERYASYGERIGFMHSTTAGACTPLPFVDTAVMSSRCMPASGRGPAHDLGRFYETMLAARKGEASHWLQPDLAVALTSPAREPMYDARLGQVVSWGLGFMVGGLLLGQGCRESVFGHSGLSSSAGFADPENELAVAWVVNGLVELQRANPRCVQIGEAIRHDLGL